jgi:diaminopimelate epimerase
MQFAKYHGCGNDFLVVDLRTATGDDAGAPQDPAVVRALCDRQFGVGGDGVLAVLPPVTAGADARMRVLNADGSEAEMCGNGLRCVVKYLHDRGGIRQDRLVIDTGAGALACVVTRSPDGLATHVTVDMGRPRLTRAEIPMTGPADERCIEQTLSISGDAPGPGDTSARRVTAVSMGNPHAIAFVGSRDEAMRLAETVGTRVENHAWFPRRTNAEFAHVRSATEIDLVVWERGCGITLACGTGACATAVAACLTGQAQVGQEIQVHLPGGSLGITVAPDYATVLMRGPATFVFDGVLDPRAVEARPT